MGARFRSWWQQIKQHLVLTTIIIVIGIAIFITVAYLLNWEWVGFNAVYSRIWTIELPKTSNGKTIFQIKEQQQAKTLWDWLQLLIIPAVLAVAGYIINLTISRGEQEATKQRAQSEREAAEKRAETEREIALDNQREALLQEFIDKISELLLHEKLLESHPDDKIRTIARVRTRTALLRLDSKRKSLVLQFLYRTGLIDIDNHIVDLFRANLNDINLSAMDESGADLIDFDQSSGWLHAAILSDADLHGVDMIGAKLVGANLSGAYLIGADLNNADLRGANLSEANLRQAILGGANLSGVNLFFSSLSDANLEGADLSGANLKNSGLSKADLSKAKSLQGATMPDGSIHP